MFLGESISQCPNYGRCDAAKCAHLQRGGVVRPKILSSICWVFFFAGVAWPVFLRTVLDTQARRCRRGDLPADKNLPRPLPLLSSSYSLAHIHHLPRCLIIDQYVR